MKNTEAPGDNIKWLEINFRIKKLGGSNSKDSSLSTKQWAAAGKKKNVTIQYLHLSMQQQLEEEGRCRQVDGKKCLRSIYILFIYKIIA